MASSAVTSVDNALIVDSSEHRSSEKASLSHVPTGIPIDSRHASIEKHPTITTSAHITQSHIHATHASKSFSEEEKVTTVAIFGGSVNATTMEPTSTAIGDRTLMVPPGKGASREAQKEFLEYQLEGMQGRVVLGCLVFLDGEENRARGGMLSHSWHVSTLHRTFNYP